MNTFDIIWCCACFAPHFCVWGWHLCATHQEGIHLHDPADNEQKDFKTTRRVRACRYVEIRHSYGLARQKHSLRKLVTVTRCS